MSSDQRPATLDIARIGNVPNVPQRTAWGDRWGVWFRTWWPYYLMLAPGLIYFVVFHYFPIYQAKLAFEDFRIFGGNTWVGLKHFATLVNSPAFYQVLLNTLIISTMK